MQTIDSYIEPISALLSRVEKQIRLMGSEKIKALYPPGFTIDHDESEQFENLITAMEREIILSEELSNEDKKYWYGYARSFKSLWAKYSDPVYCRTMIITKAVSEYLDKNNPYKLWVLGLEEGILALENLVREYGGEHWEDRRPVYEISDIFDYVFDRIDYYKNMLNLVKPNSNCGFKEYRDVLKEAYRLAWGHEIPDYILVENARGGYESVNLRQQQEQEPMPPDWMWQDHLPDYASYRQALRLVLIDNGNPVCYRNKQNEYVEIEMLKVKTPQ